MGLIKTSGELTFSPTMTIMIYGQPGVGKTTLALSAGKPCLLLDFDNGAKRIAPAHRHDHVGFVPVKSWKDIVELLNDRTQLEPFKVIIVDTVGKMMDFIISSVNPSMRLRLNDWGKVNSAFKDFNRTLASLGKTIVYVAHRDIRHEGEDMVFVPSMRERNYTSIVTELDMLGYVEMRAEGGVVSRTITFDPTTRNDGKNTCRMPASMVVPTVLDKDGNVTMPNDFLEREVIGRYAKALEEDSKREKEYAAMAASIDKAAAAINTADDANAFVKDIAKYAVAGTTSKEYARAKFSARVKALGLKYDKSTKLYGN